MEYILYPLRPTHLELRKLLVLVFISVLIGLAFGAVYLHLSKFLAPVWLAAAAFHSLLAFCILMVLFRQQLLAATFSLRSSSRLPTKALYAPALVIIVGTILALVISGFLGNAESLPVDWSTQWAFILWIPVIEEVVFRAGVGSSLQRYAPGIWGMWFSALIFAWVHTSPSLSAILSGQMGLPLGPFFLGLICEYLRVAGGSLVPAVVFHMVCNTTVVVFSLFDVRWMNWLGWLYS